MLSFESSYSGFICCYTAEGTSQLLAGLSFLVVRERKVKMEHQESKEKRFVWHFLNDLLRGFVFDAVFQSVQSLRATVSLLSRSLGTSNEINMTRDEQSQRKENTSAKSNGSRRLASVFSLLSGFSPAEQNTIYPCRGRGRGESSDFKWHPEVEKWPSTPKMCTRCFELLCMTKYLFSSFCFSYFANFVVLDL